MRRMITAIALGACLLAIAAAPATARQLWHENWSFEAEFTWQECDGFDIIADATFWGVETHFIDENGNEREIIAIRMDADMYQSETGELIGTAIARNVLLAPIDGLLTSDYVGMRIRESYFGGGSYVSIGRIRFDGAGDPYFVAGPHPWELGEVDRCALVPA